MAITCRWNIQFSNTTKYGQSDTAYELKGIHIGYMKGSLCFVGMNKRMYTSNINYTNKRMYTNKRIRIRKVLLTIVQLESGLTVYTNPKGS